MKVKAEAPNPSGFLNPQDVQSLPPVRQDLASSLSGRHISLFTMGRLIHQSPHFFIWHLIWAKDYRMRLALNRNLRRPHLPGFTVKTLLARFTPRKAIGLYIDEQELVLKLLASTPLGIVELASRRESYAPDELPEAVSRLLGPFASARKRYPYPVAVGVATRRVFYSTRPVRSENENTSAQALLRDVLQSPNVCIDEMTVEVIKGEIGKKKLASVASCRKDYLFELLQALQDCGVQPFRTEPAPLALLRVGSQHRRARRSKAIIRAFLGESESLILVAVGARCIFWKSCKLPEGGELAALSATIRSCQGLIRRCGMESAAEVVIVHGRTDLHARLTDEEFVQKAGIPVTCCSAPELDGEEIACGLALGCLQEQSAETIDLTQSLTPTPSLWRIVPWGEAALQVALVVCMGLFLLTRTHGEEKIIAPVRAELQRHAWVGRKAQVDLVKEKKELATRVDAVRKFVDSRIAWTQYIHDISVRLPETATLTAFQGTCELEKTGKGKSKPKKSFLIRATAPISDDGSTPKEIDQFLADLRFNPLLQKDFPSIEVADIKTSHASKGGTANAIFTVVCLPKASPPPAAKGKGKKEKSK